MRVLQAVSVCLALVVAAWFALGVRQASSLNRAEAIINAQTHTTAARAHKAESLLDDAGFLNPDREVDIDRVHILLERGEVGPARNIIDRARSAEPDNIETWIWFAHVALAEPGGRAQSLYDYAMTRIHQLDPSGP